MKLLVLSTALASLLFSPCMAMAAENQPGKNKVQWFMESQAPRLSKEFPYRINLFTQGQITKNQYGTRISELATQFPRDTLGQFFFYKVLDESMRVPHWHANATEVGTVISGKMRVTIWEGVGNKQVFTVNPNNTWMIPKGALHSLENVGKEDLTFVLAYNAPATADVQYEQAVASLPDAILESALGLTPEEIKNIKQSDFERLSGFDPSATPEKADDYNPYSSDYSKIEPIYQSQLGSIKRVDASNNTKMKEMAFQQTILKPGTLRLPHWYTSGDSFLYISSGEAFFTMMDYDGNVFNVTAKPGDLIFLPIGSFHGFLNIGKQDLVIYEVFNAASNIQEISLLEGAKNLNPGAFQGALGLNKASADRILKQATKNYMVAF